MESKKMKACLAPIFFLIFSHILGTHVAGKKSQGEYLTRLRNSKRHVNSIVEASLLDAAEIEIEIDEDSIHEQASKQHDRIVKLPGQPDVSFNQYGGYVTIDEHKGRAFYYYFAEAESHSNSKPLLLWLNGGPGCSSLAYGAMEEIGPFRVHSDGKSLYKNKFAWNKAANVLFLESPAGVGFSYSNTTSDFVTGGDKRTAKDNYLFLRSWLKRFPEYKNRDFYISGESYAGHYVPQLAHTILHHNKKSNKTHINLKGIMIGNAVINDETDERGMYEYFETHALASEESIEELFKICDFSPHANVSSACNVVSNQIYSDNIRYIDFYNIYAPLCHNTNLTTMPKKTSLRNFDPCSDYYVIAYLNTPSVQEALHANVTKLKYDWQPCSDVLQKWEDSPTTVIPLLQEFMANGLRVWVYSGDVDGRVPVTSTQKSIRKMKLPIKTSWHPWFLNQEVGGYTQEYKGDLTFATVRGAGHEVPSFQPLRALSLITHFLAGRPLPTTPPKLNV